MNILLYNGQEINQRADGYVNATQMAVINGVRLDNYFTNKATQAYLDVFKSSLEFQGTIPVKASTDRNSSDFGTWMHPVIVIHFAQWVSPAFHFWCNTHIKILIETGKTELRPSTPVTYLEALKALVATEEEKERLKLLAEAQTKQLAQKDAEIVILEVDNLRQAEVIDELFDYSSIVRIAKFNGCSEKAFSWRKLKSAALTLNLEVKRVPCPRFETKLLYPHAV